MAIADLFPQPKHLDLTGGDIHLAGRHLTFLTETDDQMIARGVELIERRWEQLQEGVSERDDPYAVMIRIDDDPAGLPEDAGDEGYALTLASSGGSLLARTPEGVFTGCQTLRSLLPGSDEVIPALTIRDWPDFAYRGLYVESKWGSDRMTLDDWKAAIDRMAELKFNSLGIGIYGCWIVQYGGQRTEFLMVPFPDHPDLKTPKTLRYYSPGQKAWQTLEYLPAMVTEDSFGEIVAYGKAHNVHVRPHFNSPGHNTVIPRVFPEISARDASGQPMGYGFCLSNSRTYDVLFELYDSVVDRYLLPNGVDWFHMGLDEVEGYKGISEEDPSLVIDPWCRCPDCHGKPRDRQLQEYAIRVALHLKEKGINHITMWNDALDKLGALDNGFAAQVEEAGLADNLAVQYWRYHEPVLIPPDDLGLRTWSTPMAGYWPNMFTQSYTANISRMLLHGFRAGAEGADAYCLYDPAFDRNYVCLAQYAWNQTTSEDLYQFKSRYARSLLTPMLDAHLAVEAFDQYDQVFDTEPLTETYLASLLYYWHTYPAARERGSYPRDVLLEIRSSHMRASGGFQRAAESAKAAASLFALARETCDDPMIEEYVFECTKFVNVWSAFSTAIKAIDSYDAARAAVAHADRVQDVNRSAVLVGESRDLFERTMSEAERVKSPFLVPQLLRDLSAAFLYFDRLARELELLAAHVGSDGMAPLPAFLELGTNQENLDPYLSSTAAPPPVQVAAV
jgi:hypothetical protein